jgi:hypothetical protein
MNMVEYKAFVEHLDNSLIVFKNSPEEDWHETALKYVNGFAEEELRRLVSLEKRRNSGAFFTNHTLAEKVLLSTKFRFNKDVTFYDPACGAGNLLLAACDVFGEQIVRNRLQCVLLGTDLYQEFVDAAKLRISINALLKKTFNNTNCELNGQVKDGLIDNPFYKIATHVITNPPFNLINSPKDIKWAKGKVSAAAVFIDKIIEFSNPGTSIIAILPDVLRSGTRYEKWREIVDTTCHIEKIHLWGQFDQFADVDVFSLLLTKRQKPKNRAIKKVWTKFNLDNNSVISNIFDICVGTVVDNRDQKVGDELPYIVSRGLPNWTEINGFPLTRRHSGKRFTSPFVVVKRTSRMGDGHRAIGTIINIENPVFVDNHLIVLKPKSGLIEDCHFLIDLLQQERTDEWLNAQIRCRHLTVKVVSNIPL